MNFQDGRGQVGAYGGWIKFDCNEVGACVKTTWRPDSNAQSGGSGMDVCLNIMGIQNSVPNGFSLNNNMCLEIVVDVCPNLDGVQASVPVGYSSLPNGACVSNQLDYCPNLDGVQLSVPLEYTVTEVGDCKKAGFVIEDSTAEDMCLDISGVQGSIPLGYQQDGDSCIVVVKDICLNIPDQQTTIPDGQMIDESGNCVPLRVDLCSNIAGDQNTVPKNFIELNSICLLNTQENSNLLASTYKIVAYPFIPRNYQIPVIFSPLNRLVHVLDTPTQVDSSHTTNYKFDLVTIGLTIGFGLGVVSLVLIFLWGRVSGVIYNASTNEVLKQVGVRIFSLDNKLVGSIVTDKYGKYRFRVKKGDYRIEVDSPENYSFPASVNNSNHDNIINKKTVFENHYYGGTVTVPRSGRINLNIPLEPLV